MAASLEVSQRLLTSSHSLTLPELGCGIPDNYHVIYQQSPAPGMSSSRQLYLQLLRAYQAAVMEGECIQIVVVVDSPSRIMPAVRKNWFGYIRTLARERSSTLRRERIIALNRQVERMTNTRFIVGLPNDDSEGGVFFVEQHRTM